MLFNFNFSIQWEEACPHLTHQPRVANSFSTKLVNLCNLHCFERIKVRRRKKKKKGLCNCLA